MSISKLPNELIGIICDYLHDDYSKNAFLQTCRRFAYFLQRSLYRHNAIHSGGTALGWAAMKGFESTALYALEAGASLDEEYEIPGIGLWPPLGVACRFGNEPLAHLLITHGADLDLDFPGGYTIDEDPDCCTWKFHIKNPLLLAVSWGHEHVVRLLLSKGARPDYTYDGPYDITPVRLAVIKGHINIVELLADRGCDLSRGNLLSDAALRGDYEMVKYLIHLPHLEKHWQRCAFDALCAAVDLYFDPRVNTKLATVGPMPSPRFQVHTAGHFAAAQEIRRSVDLDKIIYDDELFDKRYAKLLFICSGCGWEDLVERLLELDYPPIITADQYCGREIYLDRYGVVCGYAWGIPSYEGLSIGMPTYGSPLALASHLGHRRVVGKLLSYGGSGAVDRRPQEEIYWPDCGFFPTPLFLAVDAGHLDIVKILLDHGADPNLQIVQKIEHVRIHIPLDDRLEWEGREVRVSPLSRAFQSPINEDILELLLEAVSDQLDRVNGLDCEHFKDSIFCGALALGNIGMIDFLNGKVPLEDCTCYGRPDNEPPFYDRCQSALYAAAYGGVAAIERLLAGGYHIDSNCERTDSEMSWVLQIVAKTSDVGAIDLIFNEARRNSIKSVEHQDYSLLTLARGDNVQIAATVGALVGHGVAPESYHSSSLVRIGAEWKRSVDCSYNEEPPFCLEEYVQVLLDNGADPCWHTKGQPDTSNWMGISGKRRRFNHFCPLGCFASLGLTKCVQVILKALETRGFSQAKWKRILNNAERGARRNGYLRTAHFLHGYYHRMQYPVPGAV